MKNTSIYFVQIVHVSEPAYDQPIPTKYFESFEKGVEELRKAAQAVFEERGRDVEIDESIGPDYAFITVGSRDLVLRELTLGE